MTKSGSNSGASEKLLTVLSVFTYGQQKSSSLMASFHTTLIGNEAILLPCVTCVVCYRYNTVGPVII